MGRRHRKHESSDSSDSESSSSSGSSSSSSGSSVSEKELNAVEQRLNKKMKKLYCQFLWHLRRDPCLQVNGSDCYGNMYSNSVHTVAVGDDFPFDSSATLLNILYSPPGDSKLTVQRSGMYYFSWQVLCDQPCQVTLCVNGTPLPNYTMGNNSGATQTSGSQLIPLNVGDSVSLRNWKSSSVVTTTFSAASSDPTIRSNNLDLTLVKIGPIIDCNPCGPPPCPLPITGCCHEEEHSDHEGEPPCPPPHPPAPCENKCEKKFEKIDCNADGNISLEEYKKWCEKRKHKHHRHHHRHHSRDSRRH